MHQEDAGSSACSRDIIVQLRDHNIVEQLTCVRGLPAPLHTAETSAQLRAYNVDSADTKVPDY